MPMGVIDLLCVTPHAEVVKYGIPFVCSLIEDGLDKKRYREVGLGANVSHSYDYYNRFRHAFGA